MASAWVIVAELALGLVLLAGVVAVLVWGDRLRLRRRVVVNLLDGTAFSGVLWRRAGRQLVLRDVARMQPGDHNPTPVDGEILLDRGVVDFVQVLPAGGEH